MESSEANQGKEVDQDPQQQNVTEGNSSKEVGGGSAISEVEEVQARGRPQRGGQRQKGAKDKRANQEKEAGNKKKKSVVRPYLPNSTR